MTSRLSRWWKSLTGAQTAPADPPEPPRALRFASNAELEAKVDAAGDEAAWAIYGDWLQTQGDGRGELLALMAQGLDAEANAWVLRHHDQLFGSLARHTPWLKNKKVPVPFVRYAPHTADDAPIHRQRLRPHHAPVLIREVEWDHGFVARASIDPATEQAISPRDLLTQFLRLPICRFLRELGFGVEAHGPEHYPELFAVIDESAPKSLKRLIVGDFVYPDECEMSWANLEDVAGVFRLKGLEAVTICGNSAGLGGPADAGHLRAFSRQTGGLGAKELEPIVKGTWTRLERLELWTGTENYGGDCTIDHLAPLLDAGRFPKLTHLALKNSELADALIDPLVKSNLLPKLRALDLSMGTLGPEGAETLVAQAGAFRHLALLDLRDNYLSDDAAKAIAAVLPQTQGLKTQRDAEESDGIRYAAVGE